MIRLTIAAKRLRQTLLLMIGVPDYDRYVAHQRLCHPEMAIMSYEQFFQERQNSRYAAAPGKISRCC